MISYKIRRIKRLILQGTGNSHTQKRRHRTSIRREREFETVYSTEGVSGQGRRRLIPQNDKILSSYTTCLENRYSVTIIQSATVIDNNATFVTEQQDSCLTTRLWQLNSEQEGKDGNCWLNSVTVYQCDIVTCYNQFMTESNSLTGEHSSKM